MPTLSINEVVAINARLIKSASRPISNDKINEQKDLRNSSEANLDKNSNVKKFSPDLESDWTVKNDKPHNSIKEHATVDVENGFVLSQMPCSDNLLLISEKGPRS